MVCDAGHGFEGWFRNSADFETQSERGLLRCPVCGSDEVGKGLMAPAVSTARRREALSEAGKLPAAPQAEAPAQQAVVPAGDNAAPAAAPAPSVPVVRPEEGAMAEMRAEVLSRLRELKQAVMTSAEDVGTAFPEEARKIHYGETEKRGIYGSASPDDVESLIDEGIAVLPLPVLPEDRN
nr:DUF1178 family protein [Stappia taiwanensis]